MNNDVIVFEITGCVAFAPEECADLDRVLEVMRETGTVKVTEAKVMSDKAYNAMLKEREK